MAGLDWGDWEVAVTPGESSDLHKDRIPQRINLFKKKRLLFIYQFSITAQDGQSSHSVLQIVGLDNHPPGSVVAGLKPAAPGFSGARGLKD